MRADDCVYKSREGLTPAIAKQQKILLVDSPHNCCNRGQCVEQPTSVRIIELPNSEDIVAARFDLPPSRYHGTHVKRRCAPMNRPTSELGEQDSRIELSQSHYVPAKWFAPKFRDLSFDHHGVQFNVHILFCMMTSAQC